MPNHIQFAIENARSFRNTGFQPISPLTLLVGENSSGKTSFFALLYEALSFFGFIEYRSSYFDLGTLADIVHTRSDRKLRSHYTVSFNVTRTTTDIEDDFDRDISDIAVSISFGESKGKRISKQIACSFSGQQVIFSSFRDAITVQIKTIDIDVKVTVSYRDRRFQHYNMAGFWGISDLFGALSRYEEGSTKGYPYTITITKGTQQNLIDLGTRLSAFERAFDSLAAIIGGEITTTAAMRSEPQRVYTSSMRSSEEEGQTPHKLYRLQQYEPELWSRVRAGLRSFGISSGLFDDIEVRSLRGRRKSGPFEIIVSRQGISSNIMDVGYGISQAMPFISDILIAKESQVDSDKRLRTFYIQQPETHLHPSAQAAIGSFFFELSRDVRNRVVIETHSDFIVDRIRQLISTCEEDCSSRVSMLFFENRTGVSTVYPINFDRLGNVLDAPPGYREFFVREELRNIGVLDVPHN